MTTTPTEVKSRPILFSGPMVKAILEGRKTQERRVGKDQNHRPVAEDESGWYYQTPITNQGLTLWDRVHVPCPYGNPWAEPKDLLWVKETFWYQDWLNLPSSEPQPIHYTADGFTECLEDYKQKPSIFMPRWASRITLEVTGVRVERLNDITEEDAIAEGMFTNAEALKKLGLPLDTKLSGSCVDKFRIVWESLNGKKFPWASNPWCWAISFRQVDSLAEGKGEGR